MPEVKVILVVSKGKTLTWLDDCRIPYQSEDDYNYTNRFLGEGNKGLENYRRANEKQGYDKLIKIPEPAPPANEKGRFPANLLVSDDCLNDGKITRSPKPYLRHVKSGNVNAYHDGIGDKANTISNNYGDEGSYSRYFDLDIWAKTHNIPKPYSLISYLITMGSREGDLVLSDNQTATENLKRKWTGKKKDCYY